MKIYQVLFSCILLIIMSSFTYADPPVGSSQPPSENDPFNFCQAYPLSCALIKIEKLISP